MLRGFYFLFSILLIFSCKKSSVNSSVNNEPTIFLPIAPTNLSGSTDTSFKTTLNWSDNSTNEDGFKIERKLQNENYSVIGTALKDVTKFVDTGLLENTTYFYRVYSYNSKGSSLTYSNEALVKTVVLPKPNMNIYYTSFTNNKAVIEGSISGASKNAIIDKGIVWSSNLNPTIADSKISYGAGYNVIMAGEGYSQIKSLIKDLSKNTSYNVRVYAAYSFGTFYSNNLSFTTLNETVKIGNQEWATSNLDVAKYTDGTPIPQVTDVETFNTLKTGAWCYLSNDTSNDHKYGKLYNWYAVMGIYDETSRIFPPNRKKLAPQGYHIPSYDEFGVLIAGLGGLNDAAAAAAKLKVNYTWPTKGNNSSGFSALPGGNVSSYSNANENLAWWWSSTEYDSNNASYMHIANLPNVDRVIIAPFNTKTFFQSVRCIKD